MKEQILEFLRAKKKEQPSSRQPIMFSEILNHLLTMDPDKGKLEIKNELHARLEHLKREGLIGVYYSSTDLLSWSVWLKEIGRVSAV